MRRTFSKAVEADTLKQLHALREQVAAAGRLVEAGADAVDVVWRLRSVYSALEGVRVRLLLDRLEHLLTHADLRKEANRREALALFGLLIRL